MFRFSVSVFLFCLVLLQLAVLDAQFFTQTAPDARIMKRPAPEEEVGQTGVNLMRSRPTLGRGPTLSIDSYSLRVGTKHWIPVAVMFESHNSVRVIMFFYFYIKLSQIYFHRQVFRVKRRLITK